MVEKDEMKLPFCRGVYSMCVPGDLPVFESGDWGFDPCGDWGFDILFFVPGDLDFFISWFLGI